MGLENLDTLENYNIELDYCTKCDIIITNKFIMKHCNKCNQCHINKKFIHCKICKFCIDVYSDKDYIEHRRRHTI